MMDLAASKPMPAAPIDACSPGFTAVIVVRAFTRRRLLPSGSCWPSTALGEGQLCGQLPNAGCHVESSTLAGRSFCMASTCPAFLGSRRLDEIGHRLPASPQLRFALPNIVTERHVAAASVVHHPLQNAA